LYKHRQLNIAMPIGIIISFWHEFMIKCKIALIINPTATAAMPYNEALTDLKLLYFFQ
jgi:hypothetical protein